MESDERRDFNSDLSVRALLAEGRRRLGAAGVAEPQRDARLLLRWAAGWDGAGLAKAESDAAPLASETAARFRQALAARSERRPVSHILGERSFYGRGFLVSEAVLDPRPESETLIEAALAAISPGRPARLLDLGVGSGCLIATVLAERPAARGVGVDISAAALETAAENAQRLGVADRLELRQGDWLAPVAGDRFDAILCNPPYIPRADLAGLEPEVRLWEPAEALSPGEDGLAVYRFLAPQIAKMLLEDGVALFEVGRGQAGAAAALFHAEALNVETRSDLGGVGRTLLVTAAAPSRIAAPATRFAKE